MSQTHTNDAAKAKAEATFKRRELQAREGAIAMKEYLANQEATRAKTERLRALRLANEAAADTQAAAQVKAKPAKAQHA